MGKININLPEALHKAVKKRAIDKGVYMKVWIVDVLEVAAKGKEGEKNE